MLGALERLVKETHLARLSKAMWLLNVELLVHRGVSEGLDYIDSIELKITSSTLCSALWERSEWS